jgi:putative two-component system response regulator
MRDNNRILAVDDNADNLAILDELLGTDYTVLCTTSGEDALRIAFAYKPDLILLDVMMPGLDGVETCRQLRQQQELKSSRIVMLSAKQQLHDRLSAYDAGAVDYITKPFDHLEVLAKVKALMQMKPQDQLEDVWREMEMASQAIGSAMLNLASFRDTETGGHLVRVRWYCQALAERLDISGPYRAQIDSTFCENLYRASPLHDIGKVAIDDAILRKPGPLTREEFEVMKTHTTIGSDLLRAAANKLRRANYLEMAAEVARYHHERFDGMGYPERLAGVNIPLAARILSVADVFDALTSKRVYKEAVSFSKAAAIILEESGQQFDPVIVEAFRVRIDDFHQAYSCFAESGDLKISHMALPAESGKSAAQDSLLESICS